MSVLVHLLRRESSTCGGGGGRATASRWGVVSYRVVPKGAPGFLFPALRNALRDRPKCPPTTVQPPPVALRRPLVPPPTAGAGVDWHPPSLSSFFLVGSGPALVSASEGGTIGQKVRGTRTVPYKSTAFVSECVQRLAMPICICGLVLSSRTPTPPPPVEDSLLKRRTHTYPRQYQPAHSLTLHAPPPPPRSPLCRTLPVKRGASCHPGKGTEDGRSPTDRQPAVSPTTGGSGGADRVASASACRMTARRLPGVESTQRVGLRPGPRSGQSLPVSGTGHAGRVL